MTPDIQSKIAKQQGEMTAGSFLKQAGERIMLGNEPDEVVSRLLEAAEAQMTPTATVFFQEYLKNYPLKE